jgi:hypothetical protein
MLALFLGLLFSVGCATGSYGHVDAELVSAQAGTHLQAGLQQTGSGEAKAILYCVVGILLVAALVIDIIALPGTCHDPFPCCRGIISICH